LKHSRRPLAGKEAPGATACAIREFQTIERHDETLSTERPAGYIMRSARPACRGGSTTDIR
jgi:hypothetical protein